MRHLPSVQDVHVVLFCSGLNIGDFLVSDNLANIVVGDVSKVRFPDEKACVRCEGVYVLLKLIRAIRLCDMCPHDGGYVPFSRGPGRWKRSMIP